MTCGEIWWIDFGVPYGSEPGYRRPVLVIQSDALNNSRLNTTIVLPITTNTALADLHGNTFISKENSGLPKDSVVVGIQIGVVDKGRFIEQAGEVDSTIIEKVLDELFSILG